MNSKGRREKQTARRRIRMYVPPLVKLSNFREEFQHGGRHAIVREFWAARKFYNEGERPVGRGMERKGERPKGSGMEKKKGSDQKEVGWRGRRGKI